MPEFKDFWQWLGWLIIIALAVEGVAIIFRGYPPRDS